MKQLLVGWPCASPHQHFALITLEESLHNVVAFGGLCYLVHTVEACVACQRTLLDTNAFQ